MITKNKLKPKQLDVSLETRKCSINIEHKSAITNHAHIPLGGSESGGLRDEQVYALDKRSHLD